MTVQDVLLKIDQRINKKATNDFDNIPVNEKVEAYNKAQLQVVTSIISPKDVLRQGAESTTRRTDDLKMLIVDEPHQLTVTKKDRYYITNSFPDDYFQYWSSESVAFTSTCKKKIIRNIEREESSIHLTLRNDTMNPSFLWAETPITLVKDKMKVWTDNKFGIKSVYLTYMIIPPPIDAVGYFKENGSPSVNIDPILPDNIVEMCIDRASVIIQGDIGNQAGVQVAQLNASNDE